MSPLGHRLTRGFIQAANDLALRYERSPEVLRQSFLPFAMATLPLAIGSAFGPLWLMPLLMLMSLALLREVAIAAEPMMFAVGKVRAHLAVTMPLCSFISVWGIGLALAGRSGVMLSVVGPYCMLLLLACAPAYRLAESRTTRRVPLKYTFPALAVIAWLASFRFFVRG